MSLFKICFIVRTFAENKCLLAFTQKHEMKPHSSLSPGIFKGIKNVLIINDYQTPEALHQISCISNI